MVKKDVRHIKLFTNNGGKIKMYGLLAKQRPLYTNNEIAMLISKKMKKENKSIENISFKYNVDDTIVEYMLDGRVEYTIRMLEIASDYLRIPYDEITSIIRDDDKCNCRGKKIDEGVGELIDIINYLFSESIRQERLSRRQEAVYE